MLSKDMVSGFATNLPQGKGFFIWQPDLVEGGDPARLAAAVKAAGFGHVVFKVANDTHAYPYTAEKRAMVVSMVQAIRRDCPGVQVFGYGYIYLVDPVGEAGIAIQRVSELALDGYYIDAEGECKGKPAAASIYMDRLRTALPSLPVLLCSYRYPSYHPTLPWAEFLAGCDAHAPQVYWVDAHNPVEQLIRSMNELKALRDLPVVPVFSAYQSGTWSPTVDEVVRVLEYSKASGFMGCNFWEWGNARRNLPQVWEAIANFVWSQPEPPPPPEPEPDKIDILLIGMSQMQQALATLDQKVEYVSHNTDAILDIVRAEMPPPDDGEQPPENLGWYQVVDGEKANGYWQVGVNARGKPVLGLPPVGARKQWGPGDRVRVILPDADVDGSVSFWVVYGQAYEGNEFDNPRVYVKQGDGHIVP